VHEADLIARVRAGEPAAERELYDAHVDRVYRLAYRLVGDGDLARDVTQDTFIRVFERLHEFRGEAQLSTWVHSIALSMSLNVLRKVKRMRREVSLEQGENVAGTTREAEPDLKQRLTAAIDALPAGYRAVFVMHDVEGFTHEEIGGALGIATGTSKAQLSHARAKLRVALAEFAEGWAV